MTTVTESSSYRKPVPPGIWSPFFPLVHLKLFHRRVSKFPKFPEDAGFLYNKVPSEAHVLWDIIKWRPVYSSARCPYSGRSRLNADAEDESNIMNKPLDSRQLIIFQLWRFGAGLTTSTRKSENVTKRHSYILQMFVTIQFRMVCLPARCLKT